MNKKYLAYSIEDLIQDRDFVSWVIRQKHHKEWIEFIKDNPEFGETVKTARKIIHLLEDSYQNLSEEDVFTLWTKIDTFENNQKKQLKTIRMNQILRYAAVVTLILAISGLSALYYLNHSANYSFTKADRDTHSNNSTLILSNGDEIKLAKDHSKIALNNNAIQINNDSIIKLQDIVNNTDMKKMNQVIVPYGKHSQLVLEDGTKVWLNAGSRLAFPSKFDGKKRTVFLEGEAYFDVTHNKEKPFLVNVNDVEVKVLGTRFNVSAYSSEELIETVLLEGKVAINKIRSLGFLAEEVILSPNQKATYNKKQKTTIVKNEPEADISIAWINGWFSFSQQSLINVLRKLERYYNVKFQYNNQTKSDELITGKLDIKDSLEDILVFLSELAKVNFRIDNDIIYVEKLPMKN